MYMCVYVRISIYKYIYGALTDGALTDGTFTGLYLKHYQGKKPAKLGKLVALVKVIRTN